MPRYTVTNCSIQSILGWLRMDAVAIPEMQRPFVWKPVKVRDLIDSLYAGFPIGYIIRWSSPNVTLRDGSIAAGRNLLIDGQQRIMALHAAIIGEDVLTKEYARRRIRIAFNPMTKEFDVCNAAIERNPMWIADIAKVFKPDFYVYAFVTQYGKDHNLDEECRSQVAQAIQDLISIQNASIGVIELEPSLTIEEVTEIFIRINSTGVVLSQADFAMSKVAAEEKLGGPRIRRMIDYFCHLLAQPEDYALIYSNDSHFTEWPKIQWARLATNVDIYQPDYADVLRVAFTFKFVRGKLSDLVSLLSGRDFDTRTFKQEIVEQSFGLLNEGVQCVVNETNFKRYQTILLETGIITDSLSPAQNILNFGYALYLLLYRQKQLNHSHVESCVRRWLLLSLLTGRYSGSAETIFDVDIKRFASAQTLEDVISEIVRVEEAVLPDTFWTTALMEKLETSSVNGPMFQVFLMAQVRSNDNGFLATTSVRNLIQQREDIHHIFPKNYLRQNGITERAKYNQIANYAYTSTVINRHIGDRAPVDYMVDAQSFGGFKSREYAKQNLEGNAIPDNLFEMDYTYYEDFLAQRRKLMAAKIRAFYNQARNEG